MYIIEAQSQVQGLYRTLYVSGQRSHPAEWLGGETQARRFRDLLKAQAKRRQWQRAMRWKYGADNPYKFRVRQV